MRDFTQLPNMDKYAELVIHYGINLQKNMCLNIATNIDTYYFARLLAIEAYKVGAQYVTIQIIDNYITQTRIAMQDEEKLTFIPYYMTAQHNEMGMYHWSNIRIDNTAEQDVLANVDSKKFGIMTKALSMAKKSLSHMYMSHNMSWCVVAAPGYQWAMRVLEEEDREVALENMWNVLQKILRLDAVDVISAWQKHDEILHRRRAKLTECNLHYVHFKSKLTDLKVYLNTTSIWQGGSAKTVQGYKFLPNLPTEEVFTTPDWRKTEGVVIVQKPVKILENLVYGAWFEFLEGKVIKYGAEKNQHILDEFFNTDEYARCLGELALVDEQSPIGQSGLVFNSILYDENASCHIALGSGYPFCLSNASVLSTTESLLNAGCNVSLVHTDFMIGSSDMALKGVSYDGTEYQIMENGRFVGMFINYIESSR